MPQIAQPTLQPQGRLPKSPEFGPHTPQLLTEISPDKKINLRRFVGAVATEVEVAHCTDEDKMNAEPAAIIGSLLMEPRDERRALETDPEQLIVVGRDLEIAPYHQEESEETFYYPGNLGVVFDETDFQKVARAPGDLAKAMKAQNRAQNQDKRQPETEEQFEIDIEEQGFSAIRAAIHTLDHYIAGMQDLSSSLAYKRQQWSKLHRFLSFSTYAHYKGDAARKHWGLADAEIHNLADLSALNAPKELYGMSGMHRAIKNNLYNSQAVHPADALSCYISKLIKPYTRAKYEKVRLASRAAAEVRNRHMERLPASMQGEVIADYPEAYEPHIIPRLFEEVDIGNSVSSA